MSAITSCLFVNLWQARQALRFSAFVSQLQQALTCFGSSGEPHSCNCAQIFFIRWLLRIRLYSACWRIRFLRHHFYSHKLSPSLYTMT